MAKRQRHEEPQDSYASAPSPGPQRNDAVGEMGSAAAPEAWRIAVEDNGIGFDEKYLDRIFTVFQRLQGRAAYEGTGIGLAICRRIVERHGGTITARSRPGQGSTFLVTLPARPQQGGADLGQQHEADHHPSGR